MKNRSTGRLGRLFLNAVTLESRSPGSVVINKRKTTDAGTLRAARLSSMTLCDEGRSGFTLIELLVVVLIIGILSAVALPQYQKAVDKSRVATMIPLVRSLAEAKKSYYMATGTHARHFDELDFSIPSSCSISDDEEYGQRASCGKLYLLLDPYLTHAAAARMKLGDSSVLTLAYPSTSEGKKECLACPAGSHAEMVCGGLFPNVSAVAFGEGCSGFYVE